MSTRALAIFLHRLLAGDLAPAGPVSAGATLARLAERPPPALQALLAAHVDALLAQWPGGAALRPSVVPAMTLWAGAALNNLAWVSQPGTSPDSDQARRLLAVSLRLARALPPPTDLSAAIAYHSLLRQLERLDPAPQWRPVARELLARSPLTAAWLPRLDALPVQDRLLDLLAYAPIRAALRDRWLSQAPRADAVRLGISPECASANAAVGEMLALLLASGDQWRPFVLAFYEAECALQRRGGDASPIWPLVEQLRAARAGADPRQRRYSARALARYRPLAALLADPEALRPYLHLDVRFLIQIGALLPAPHLRPPIADRNDATPTP